MILEIAKKLVNEHDLRSEELLHLIQNADDETKEYLRSEARKAADKVFGNKVFIRGLIEFTNYCRCDCFYCGIRRSNDTVQRYRLDKETILECCKEGYEAGLRTFVLQGGEDGYFTDERLCDIVASIKKNHPDCAVTLSVGERSRESYQKLYDAGADRFLLRHETADCDHYAVLHPQNQTLENRMNCLRDLKEIGYQVGCGFMVGSPGQTDECIVKDLRFIKDFEPQMVGIGPFLPAQHTPFEKKSAGSAEKTLFLLSIVRLLIPNVLLPATTALGTAEKDGRLKGILHGSNVVMPNLSPTGVRKLYNLYDNKLSSGAEAAENIALLDKSFKTVGYEVAVSRGDCPGFVRK